MLLSRIWTMKTTQLLILHWSIYSVDLLVIADMTSESDCVLAGKILLHTRHAKNTMKVNSERPEYSAVTTILCRVHAGVTVL